MAGLFAKGNMNVDAGHLGFEYIDKSNYRKIKRDNAWKYFLNCVNGVQGSLF